MTPDERRMLLDLAVKFAQTPPAAKDPEAEEIIRTRIGSRPDALYLMTQTVLIQNLALDHARREIERLQQGGAAAPAASSFHGRSVSQPPPPGWGPPPPLPPPSYGMPQASGFSGFLRGAATTAAGIAAGALAFEGIRSLFGGGLFGGEHPHSGLADSIPDRLDTANFYDPPADETPADLSADDTDGGDPDDSI